MHENANRKAVLRAPTRGRAPGLGDPWFGWVRNGAFLNGKRLPPKASAKVMLSHGDELLLQDLEGEESLEPNNT